MIEESKQEAFVSPEPSEPISAEDPAVANGEPADAESPVAAEDSAVANGEPADAESPVAAEDSTEESGETKKARSAKPAPKELPPGVVASLYRSLRSRRPIEGTIERVIKGGYEVRLGKLRGFCPHSQIDLHRVEDPEQWVGRSFPFRLTQVRRGGADVVVSRRAILEDQRADEAKAVRATLIEGAVTQGRVSSIADFGAFVDVGAGVMGLVHVSELSHARVTRVADAIRVGDTVKVKVLKLDGRKIGLSVRQAEEDPWLLVTRNYEPDGVYGGSIRRITDFGVFVELEPGLEALAPASEFPPSPSGWRDELTVGEQRDWIVLSVDPSQRRLTVTLKTGNEPDQPPKLEVGAILQGRVQRVERFGVFVWLAPGRIGLMPNALTGVPRGSDVARRYPLAESVEVEIVEVDDEGRRIRLARRGHGDKAEPRAAKPRGPRAPRRAKQQHATSSSDSSGFGTSLGDKLRAALGQSGDESPSDGAG